MTNLCLATDSYKLGHYAQYPEGTETVYSYLEARKGAKWGSTVFFGLQHILQTFFTQRITEDDIEQADALAAVHFNNGYVFNADGWQYILDTHNGFLPLRIKAVAEGTVVPVGNVLMTVENTDPKCWWLTNAMESLLLHVWYPTTVATHSKQVKTVLKYFLKMTADSEDGLDFMCHCFGYRSATTHDAAAIGGAGHLVNFKGTDTLPAMLLALDSYAADINSLAFSVPATEHSIMTSLGADGEFDLVRKFIKDNPAGIISCVADSYNYYKFVETVSTYQFKQAILEREGKFVFRPDSITYRHDTPGKIVLWTAKTLDCNLGSTVNSKGYKVLNPKVGILWGDGIDEDGISEVLYMLKTAGYSAENIVFGMGSGGLQKGLTRDTERFAFKSSAQCRDGQWHKIFKDPLDQSKKSKRGRLVLLNTPEGYRTVAAENSLTDPYDQLRAVYENGICLRFQTFEEIRARANKSEEN